MKVVSALKVDEVRGKTERGVSLFWVLEVGDRFFCLAVYDLAYSLYLFKKAEVWPA